MGVDAKGRRIIVEPAVTGSESGLTSRSLAQSFSKRSSPTNAG